MNHQQNRKGVVDGHPVRVVGVCGNNGTATTQTRTSNNHALGAVKQQWRKPTSKPRNVQQRTEPR
jgi:hypothetical protein